MLKKEMEVTQAASRVAPPCASLRIDKSECAYDAIAGFVNSLDKVEANGKTSKSLYVNLTTLVTVSESFIDLDLQRFSEDRLPTFYLELRQRRQFCTSKEVAADAEKIKKERQEASVSGKPAALPTCPRLFHTTTSYTLHVKPGTFRQALPDDVSQWTEKNVGNVPAIVLKLCRDIAGTDSVAPGMNCGAAFDDPTAVVVEQLDLAPNPQQVPSDPGAWKCQDCGRRKNLWLNLSDGHMGCGRRQYGMPESGCTGDREGAALRHYDEHPQFHLCVKLGTISPFSADVYSYLQDAPVLDKELDEHLRRLGLDRATLSQTERSTQDLAYERNQALSVGKDADALKDNLSPSDRQGLINIGNTCYIASVVLVLISALNNGSSWWRSPSQMRWHQACVGFLTSNSLLKTDLSASLAFQFLRLAFPLAHQQPSLVAEWKEKHRARFDELKVELGETVMQLFPREDETLYAGAPSPSGLKRIIGKRYREFGTSFQQDAEEFLQILYNELLKEESKLNVKTTGKKGLTDMLRVDFDIKEIVDEAKKTVRLTKANGPLLALPMPADPLADQRLTLHDLLSHWRTEGKQINSIGRFPPHLIIQVRRMTQDKDYNAIKLTHSVTMPEEMDLKEFQTTKLLEGEHEYVPEFSEEKRQSLAAFGFSDAQIASAARALGADRTVEAVVEWLLTKQGDGGSSTSADEYDPTPLMEMGFDRDIAKRALKAFKGDMEQAANALLCGEEILSETSAETPTVQEATSNSTIYRLCGAVVHLGNNASSGHYVTYVREQGKWFLYNDDKVSVVKDISKLELDRGYLYLYMQV